MPSRAFAILLLALAVPAAVVSFLGNASPPPPPDPPGPSLAAVAELEEVVVAPAAPELEAPAPAICGRLAWPDGKPFTEGDIRLRIPGSERWERSVGVVEPTDGRFRFEAPPGGTYDLEAQVDVRGHRSHCIDFDRLGSWTVSPCDRELDLRLPDHSGRALLDVRIEDDRGRPVPKGWLIADPIGRFDVGAGRELPVKDGRVRCLMRMPAKRVVLTVYRASDADGETLGRFSAGPYLIGREPIRLRLPKGRTLRGRILGPDGKGVRGADVEAEHPPPLLGFYGGWQLSDCVCGWKKTDETGAFSITHLGPGPVRLAVRAPWEMGMPRYKPVFRPVWPGENDLAIVLPAPEPEPPPCEEEVPAAESPPTVEPPAPAGAPQAEPEAPVRGEESLRLHLEYGSTYEIEHVYGEIEPDDGGPAERVRVTLPDTEIPGLSRHRTYTLRLVGVADGLALEAPGLRPGPDPITLEMKPGLSITGRIELPADADSVHLLAKRGELETPWGDGYVIYPDGRFEIPGLLPGTWDIKLTVSSEDWEWGRRSTRRLEAGGPPALLSVGPVRGPAR